MHEGLLVAYSTPSVTARDWPGVEARMERQKPHLQLVSAAFSRLSPIHPHGFDDHADSLVARAEGAARLAGAPSAFQPSFRAATTFGSVVAVSKPQLEHGP